MAGDGLEAMPMSPRRTPTELGNAVLLFLSGRRGRAIAAGTLFVVVLLAVTGVRHTSSISTSYHSITTNYHLPSWRPHLPNLPSIIHTPSKPSNITLELENGDIKHPPAQLTKSSANFHLLMPAREVDATFCRTTLSAMVMNLPPSTTINLYKTFKTNLDKEKATIQGVVDYLKNARLVKDKDLLLFVDAHDTWFQLPSEVIIRQYQNILADANQRLLDGYGNNEDGTQKYHQTIIFGAAKVCEADDLSCKYAPESILPPDIYGQKTGHERELTPAKFLDSSMVMGPAKDLRALYEAALENMNGKHSQAGTVQSVLATMFGEQELARGPAKKKAEVPAPKPKPSKWLNWFGGPISTTKVESQDDADTEAVTNTTLRRSQNPEYFLGLDYAHLLFQPLIHTTSAELVALAHDNSTDLSNFHHFDTPTPPLHLPSALLDSTPPFWTPDLSSHDPRPKNNKPAAIEPLQIQKDLDTMLPRNTPWASLDLVQNTYTGAIPAILSLRHDSTPAPTLPNVSWETLWYANHSRALLRKHIRQPQSSLGFHSAAVGGDLMWDSRGGRGGVWTVENNLWYPWGEVDGVCGTLELVTGVFGDGRGVWLHEHEEDGGRGKRVEDLEEWEKKLREEKEKEEERKKKEKGGRDEEGAPGGSIRGSR
ncbi:hypothetical protein B0J11DRAFT_158200 [Dendryphion nanum]|uniref:Uncharacterized protein n=1 Tax=Dendryphion nanum TaxID=256645 RepID=A0A9P9EDE0_9PLEO|nr:hypothetical protein B0J11DRAFT_158200 [Dendryphion nanum]